MSHGTSFRSVSGRHWKPCCGGPGRADHSRIDLPAGDPILATIAAAPSSPGQRWAAHLELGDPPAVFVGRARGGGASNSGLIRLRAGREEAGRATTTTRHVRCGGGRRQIGPLRVSLRRSREDIARTIADEILVAPRIVDLLTMGRVTGASLGDVLDCRRDVALAASRRWPGGPGGGSHPVRERARLTGVRSATFRVRSATPWDSTSCRNSQCGVIPGTVRTSWSPASWSATGWASSLPGRCS